MITVDNKFELGQDVYFVAERKALFENKCTCDVCLGSGRITYRGYNTQCPKCNGRKEMVLDSKSVLLHYVKKIHAILLVIVLRSQGQGMY